MAQATRVIERFAETVGNAAEAVVIRTEGDIDRTSPLTVIGGRGVFTSALDQALIRREIDAAVHSAKDLPTERPAELDLVAFPERDDARDVLVSRHGCGLRDLPPRPTIGTSSRRRAMQVRLRRPDARIVDLRGNIDTRLRKSLDEEIDAIVLAAAGVRRMGWDDRITEALPLAGFVPSPGQGALVIEARRDDGRVVGWLSQLNDRTVSRAVLAERAFLRTVGGGCTAPIGAHASPDGAGWRLRAMLGSEDGARVVWADEPIDPVATTASAIAVGRRLLSELAGPGGGARLATGFGPGPRTSESRVGPRTSEPRVGPRTPLAGVSVVVTRPRKQAADLLAALRARGAEAIELPAIRIEEATDSAPLDAAVERLAAGEYDWVVFTSANAVEPVARRLAKRAAGSALADRTFVAAVGRATAAALGAAGLAPDLVPARSRAEGLIEAFGARGVRAAAILYPKAEEALDVLADGLRELGAVVDEVVTYRTVPERTVPPAVVARLRRGAVDAVTFASPSAVAASRRLLGEAWSGLAHADIVCVGPVTADVARAEGLAVAMVAREPTTDGVIDALVRLRERRDTVLAGDDDNGRMAPVSLAPGGATR